MEQSDLLRYLVGVFEELGLRYFITGSTATILYGEPRFTNDIDVVVDLSLTQVVDFCRRFPPEDFYVSEVAARQAVLGRSQFNVIHPAGALKIDIIVPESDTFNKSRFARVQRLPAAEDLIACFASPEDAIIKKMDYYKQGGSEKHLRDITGVLKTSRGQIDRTYITHWAEQMGLGELWTSIQQRTDAPT